MFVGFPVLGCFEECGHDFHAQVLVWTSISKCLGKTPKSEIAEPYNKPVSPKDFDALRHGFLLESPPRLVRKCPKHGREKCI